MLFFAPPFALTATAAALGVGVVGTSLVAGYLLSSIIGKVIQGAIYGVIGAYLLTVLGVGAISMVSAGVVGALVGLAVLWPASILAGISWIFPSTRGLSSIFENGSDQNQNNDEYESSVEIAGFILEVGVIFFSSLAISTFITLGAAPAAAVATGVAAADLTVETIKDVASFAWKGF